MFEIGRMCVKLAGRDAGNRCVIVDIIDNTYCLIDGAVRRRKCNFAHLEPLDDKLEIRKGASHDDVKSAFKELGIEIVDSTPKKRTERPRRQKKKKMPEKELAKDKANSEEKPPARKQAAPKKDAPENDTSEKDTKGAEGPVTAKTAKTSEKPQKKPRPARA